MNKRLSLAFLFCCFALLIARPYNSHTAGQEYQHRLLTTDLNVLDYWPCFSPDSKTVLFSRSADKGRTWDLFVIPASGGQARRLSATRLPVSANRPNWSIKNNLVAFTGQSSDGGASVWLINSDGTLPRQLASSGLSDKVFYPSWYPDGNRLAVVDFGEGNGGVIKRIDIKNRIATPLTDRQQVLAGMPSVSPNGKWVAFAGQKNEGQTYDQTKNSIWLISETGKLQVLESNQGRTPAWSPDGQWLAFESDRGNPNHFYAAFVINRSGKGLKQVTPHELNANHPIWSPDGKLLVFSVRHSENRNATGIAIIEVPKL